MVPEFVYYIIFIITGLLIGSFLNVVIYRIPQKISIAGRRSFCPDCHDMIAFYDNIPLISFLILKGHCRHCNKKISFFYPLVEALTGALFLLNYLYFGISLKTLSGIILCSVLIIVSFIDIGHKIIPNIIVLPFTAIGLSLSTVEYIHKWWLPLVFCAGTFAFMLIINLIYPEGMGMGDVKLGMMIGAFLVKGTIAALFLGFLTGSIFGLSMIAAKKKK